MQAPAVTFSLARQPTQYYSTLSSVLRNSLRKLSEVMNKNLNLQARAFTKAEEGLLQRSLRNCRKWMDSDSLQSFLKMIRVAYRTNTQPVFKQ